MSEQAAEQGDPRRALLELYDAALPHVYGYLLSRCRRQHLAEDITAEVFLAAVAAVRRADPPEVSLPWLIGTARHKLVDHWRRETREERGLHAVASDPTGPAAVSDPWREQLDALRAQAVLDLLGPHHRAALTLRYLDDLTVPQVADVLDRSLHATEALLVRARVAFRRAYATTDLPTGDDGV
ncbi:MAG: sigma-70 family RNA polymerase sigma factor [Actinomycetota bacterium]|nr:sigma-70 family RNA polymerase sigma factor [Actinomycetota bacterium]